jgi:hypothetical protein
MFGGFSCALAVPYASKTMANAMRLRNSGTAER